MRSRGTFRFWKRAPSFTIGLTFRFADYTFMRCCPRSPFLSPLWAEMPYHRFGNSVVQHRAHPVETLRRMARRHSRPSPRPYMRTGRSGVRPDGVFHLGRHRHSRHAVKARRIVRTDVRAGRCYTTLLHDGIRSSRGICRDLCRTPLSAQRRYLFHRHCRSWDVWW